MVPVAAASLKEVVSLLRGSPESLDISVWGEAAKCAELLAVRRPPLRELTISEESPEMRAPLLASELLVALPLLEHLRLSGCPLRVDWSNAHHRSLRSLELESTHGLPPVPLAALPALKHVVVSTFFPEPMDDGMNDTLKVELDIGMGNVKFSGTLHDPAHCAVERALLSRTARVSFEVTGDADVVRLLMANVAEALGH